MLPLSLRGDDMTKVKYDRDDLTVTISGHSGYADKGYDIVCSAVSILTFTLASYAVKLNDKGMLVRNPHIVLTEGSSEVSIDVRGIYKREARTTLDAMCAGFSWLHEHYPEYLDYEVIYEGI